MIFINKIYKYYLYMYCSIQDAWPEIKNVENFNQYPELHKPNQQTQQIIEPTIDKCYSIIEHIDNCPRCKQYIMQKYGSNRLFELFNNIINIKFIL